MVEWRSAALFDVVFETTKYPLIFEHVTTLQCLPSDSPAYLIQVVFLDVGNYIIRN